MAQQIIHDLEVPQANGAGAVVRVEGHVEKCVQVSGTFDATLHVEGSLDNQNWDAVGGPTSQPEFLSVPVAIKFVRMRVTNYSSGAPKAVYSGLQLA